MLRYCWILLAIFFLIIPGELLSEEGLSLEEILELHTRAVGGKQSIEKVKAVEISLHIEEPTFQVDAVYRADRNLRMRIDVFGNGKRVFTEAFDGRNAWQMGADEIPKDSSAEGAAALWHGIVFPGKIFGLHELRVMGHRIELTAQEKVENVSYYVIKLILSDGFAKYFYINPTNWLIERSRDFRALHPDMDPKEKWIENRASDFRTVNGVLYSFKGVQVDLKTGEILQSTTVKEIKINPGLDESQFRKP